MGKSESMKHLKTIEKGFDAISSALEIHQDFYSAVIQSLYAGDDLETMRGTIEKAIVVRLEALKRIFPGD